MDQVLNALIAMSEVVLSLSQNEVKDIASSVFWCLVLLTVLLVLGRLKMIHEIITEFNKARGPIWDLRGTIHEMKELEPVIKLLADQMSLLDEKIDAARKQVQELQVDSFSSRTEEDEVPARAISAGFEQNASPPTDHWEELRQIWRRNADRIESVIEFIPDGRSRLPFDKMRRSDYKTIIDRLEASGRLTRSAANGSRELVTIFNSYRPRNRIVPADVIGALRISDEQLEKEFKAILGRMAEQAATSHADSPPTRANGGEPAAHSQLN
jgi:hypothetical protein